ncbi:MAG: transposase [Desulfovibrio sp.]|nr:MAG: transposase [Desulfovibrio sp.]
MPLNAFNNMIVSEQSAQKYLLGFCWKNHQRFCPRCKQRKLYRLKNDKRRCSRCGYTFHDFSGRFINTGKLTAVQWLWLVKLFELEVATSKIVEQTGLSHNTVFKALATIRLAILAHSLDAQLIVDHGYSLGFGNKRTPLSATDPDKDPPPPVFGIFEHAGWVFADIVPGLDAESVVHFKRNFQLKTASLGNIVYTDRYQQYATLMTCGLYLRKHHPQKHLDRGLSVDSSKGFWPYSRERLKRYKGVSNERFPLYIKELEFRYNSRQQDMFAQLVEYLCAFVPNLG